MDIHVGSIPHDPNRYEDLTASPRQARQVKRKKHEDPQDEYQDQYSPAGENPAEAAETDENV